MTENLGFNLDFTDEDVATLCQLAAFANHPQHHYYTCGWVTGHGVCSSLVKGPDFAVHLRSHHGIAGPENAELLCCWINCFAKMKKESLMRHVSEQHLEVRYTCPMCPEQFTRAYTLHIHMLNTHPGN